MAAADVQRSRCDIVELSSDDDEPTAPHSKGKERGKEAHGSSRLPNAAPRRVASMPTSSTSLQNLPEDVFTFGVSSSLPQSTSDRHRPQTFLPPPSSTAHPRPDRSLSIADEDTLMRQAAKRRKLNNLLSDVGSIAGETMPHKSSSQPAPPLSSEPRSEPRDYEKSARLKTLQAALGFSDDDLSNFEVAVGGSDNLLESLEETRAQKVQEESSSLFCSPGNYRRHGDQREQEGRQSLEQDLSCKSTHNALQRIEGGFANSVSSKSASKASEMKGQRSARRPLQERSLNILSDLSDPVSPQPTKRRKISQTGEAWRDSVAKGLGEVKEGEYMPRPQPTILDLSAYFDDDLGDSLLPLQASNPICESAVSRRLSPKSSSKEPTGGMSRSPANSGGKIKSTTALGKIRVSVVSLDSDPIATSPRKPTNIYKTRNRSIWDLNIDDQLDESRDLRDNEGEDNTTKAEAPNRDVFRDVSEFCAQESEKSQPRLSESTVQLLARISAKSKAKPRHRIASGSGNIKTDAKAVPTRSDISRTTSLQSLNTEPINGSQSKSKNPSAPKRSRLTSVEREEQEQEKERKRLCKVEERAKGKAEKEEQKRVEKEKRAREKQVAADLAEANKARTDRKVTTPEMIVDLPLSMVGTSVYTQTAPFLTDLKVQSTTYSSPVPDIIKFRRKVTARWSNDLGHWEPVPQIIESENHIICLLAGKDFAKMVALNNGLENHVAKIRREYPGSQIVYLVEGIEVLLRKSRNSKNRAFVDDVRTKLSDIQGSQGQRRKPSNADEIVDADVIEDGLLELQLYHKVQVHHTSASVETAKWIAVFTQHISTIPYK